MKHLAERILSARVREQSWARVPLTQAFGNELGIEPLGWKDVQGRVHASAVPFGKLGHWHRGVDVPLQSGSVVTVALGGRVTWSGWTTDGYGILCAIEGARYITRYGHLSRCDAQLGAWLTAGSPIGLSGSTGNSTGPHLHFEVLDKWLNAYVDPLASV